MTVSDVCNIGLPSFFFNRNPFVVWKLRTFISDQIWWFMSPVNPYIYIYIFYSCQFLSHSTSMQKHYTSTTYSQHCVWPTINGHTWISCCPCPIYQTILPLLSTTHITTHMPLVTWIVDSLNNWWETERCVGCIHFGIYKNTVYWIQDPLAWHVDLEQMRQK